MQMYETIRRELAEGGRTYIICPLVEESSSEIMTDVKAAEEEHRRLQEDGVLGDVGCGLLHGRMSSEDKFAALQAFAAGQTPVLISTTVVEVRDAPNSELIMQALALGLLLSSFPPQSWRQEVKTLMHIGLDHVLALV